MTILVTNHARDRLLSVERFGCKPKKVQKTAEKAWRSTLPLPDEARWRRREERNFMEGKTARYYMGVIFIFAPYPDKAYLITILTVGKQKTTM